MLPRSHHYPGGVAAGGGGDVGGGKGGGSAGNADKNAPPSAGGVAGAAAAPSAPVIKRHGIGKFTDAYFQYEGEWREDLIHGEGKVFYRTTGATYSGTFFKGHYDGYGVYCWPDGTRYEGQWRYNRMHGEGKYYVPEDIIEHHHASHHHGNARSSAVSSDGKEYQVYTGRFYNGSGPGLKPIPPMTLSVT